MIGSRRAMRRRSALAVVAGRRRMPQVARFLAAAIGACLTLGLPAVAAAHGPVPAAPPDLANLLLGWSFEPLVAVPLALLAIGWLVMVDRIDRAHPQNPVPLVRTVAFLAGLAAIAFALLSGIERYDTTLFSIHMVQHLLLVLVAAPLIVLAAPITQLLRLASPDVRQRWLLPILHSRAIAIVGHPIVAWLAFTAVLWASHFSPLFDLALEDRFAHDVEHLLFIGAALLFWWPVVGLDPAPHRLGYPARVLYLLTQMPLGSFLAMSILFAGAPLYHHYATLGSPYGIDPLSDQQLAAGIMWVIGDIVFIGAILGVVAAWMRHEDRTGVATDRRADVARAALRERADRLAGLPPTSAAALIADRGPIADRGLIADRGPIAQVADGTGEASSIR